eukprot:m.90210 g.90210  ORF g.90210 m.90210 type:complete len:103 (+) comp51093_c0_seq1:131-439(+)
MWRTTSAGMGSTSWLRHAPTRSDMFCADFCWRRVGLDATSGRVCVALTFFIAALLCFGLSEDYSGAFTAGVVLTFVAHVIGKPQLMHHFLRDVVVHSALLSR